MRDGAGRGAGEVYRRGAVALVCSFLVAASILVLASPAVAATKEVQVVADAYVNRYRPRATSGRGRILRTGASGSYRAFLRFPTGWHRPNRLIYSAKLRIRNISEAGHWTKITARRVTEWWAEAGRSAPRWRRQPEVASTPSPRSAGGPAGSWFTLELKKLYQHYNDQRYPDLGVRLQSPDKKVFYSGEGRAGPRLIIRYNDLPGRPSARSPAKDKMISSGAPTLRIERIPRDPNGDAVLVRYQVTDAWGRWSRPRMRSSAWTKSTSFRVPGRWIRGGGRFWWRVQSADVCANPKRLCSRVDGAGARHSWRTSEVWTFAVPPPKVVMAAGDIACDPTDSAFNGGSGTSTRCRQKYTAQLLGPADRVLALGDTQYECGGTAAYAQSYDASWGAYKDITHPVLADAEYATSGTDCGSAGPDGYFEYFGAAAHGPKGYYSFDFGGWHFVALNSNCTKIGGCGQGSAQNKWLEADLAANDEQCTLAFMHLPRFRSAKSGSQVGSSMKPFWDDLYAAGAEIVLGGAWHFYERFAPQTPSGGLNDSRGIVQFVVGTGGKNHRGLADPAKRLANSRAATASTFGVLKLTLHSSSYDWDFVVEGSSGFSDKGSRSCH